MSSLPEFPSIPTVGGPPGILLEVLASAVNSQEKFGDYHSLHEAYGVLAEEVAELFDVVRMRQSHPDRTAMARKEAIDVAAVALRIAEQAMRLTR